MNCVDDNTFTFYPLAAYFPHGFSLYLACSLHWALQRCVGREGEMKKLYTATRENFEKEKYLVRYSKF